MSNRKLFAIRNRKNSMTTIDQPLVETKPVKSPFRAQVFVCTDPWEEGCAAKGSHEILKRLRREIRDRGLRLEVRSTASFCLGGCRLGPNVVMHPDGVFYGGVSAEDVPELVDRHLLGGQAVERLLRRDQHRDQAGALPITQPHACLQAGADGVRVRYPMTLVDGLERSVTLVARPARVAAVSPGAAEIAQALAPERVAPLDDVLSSGAADGLLLADHDVPAETLGAAARAGVPVVALAEPRYVYYVQTNIGLAARALGAEERAAALNAAIDVRAEALREAAAALGPEGRRTRIVYLTPEWMTVGPYSFGATLIYGAGCENPVESRGPEEDDSIPIRRDDLAALAPDAILVACDRREAEAFAGALRVDPALSGVPAVRDRRVHVLDLARHGHGVRSQRIMDAVAAAHRLVFPNTTAA